MYVFHNYIILLGGWAWVSMILGENNNVTKNKNSTALRSEKIYFDSEKNIAPPTLYVPLHMALFNEARFLFISVYHSSYQ